MTNRSTPRFLVVAGEESGDMRAAPLLNAIKSDFPNASFFGIAGERCRTEGVDLIADISTLSVMGFVEVLYNLPRIKNTFDLVLRAAKERKPDAAILVDYPGFNLRLAAELHKLGIKVFYYVSPQVWAWKASRIKIIKKVVDRMLVLFPFEKELYARHNYQADFVGHPLIDEVHASKNRETFLKELKLDPSTKVVGLLPGSRPKELHRHLPVMLKAAAIIRNEFPESQFLILRAKNLPEAAFAEFIASSPTPVKVSTDYYNALNACDVTMTASGTATLETALMEKPMVVIYQTAWLTSVIVRLLIKIPYISLVNIVAGKKIVTELLQEKASPENIASILLDYLRDNQKAKEISREMQIIRGKLGESGASKRAARVIFEEMTKTRA
jgi:lipid-A-disaccharide synthase